MGCNFFRFKSKTKKPVEEKIKILLKNRKISYCKKKRKKNSAKKMHLEFTGTIGFKTFDLSRTPTQA